MGAGVGAEKLAVVPRQSAAARGVGVGFREWALGFRDGRRL